MWIFTPLVLKLGLASVYEWVKVKFDTARGFDTLLADDATCCACIPDRYYL